MSALSAPMQTLPRSQQSRWVRETVRSQLDMVSPPPLSVLEITLASSPCLGPNDLGPGTDILNAEGSPRGLLLSIEEDEADIAVAVGVMACLSQTARSRFVAELLRVAPAVLILNVDWSAAIGGPAFNRLRDMTASTLRAEAQDPYYGLVQHCELALAAPVGTTIVTHKAQPSIASYPGLIDEMADQVLDATIGRDRTFADRLIEATDREFEAGISAKLPTMVTSLLRRPEGH